MPDAYKEITGRAMANDDNVLRAFGDAFRSKFDRLMADMTPASVPENDVPQFDEAPCTPCAAAQPRFAAPTVARCGGSGGWGSSLVTVFLLGAIIGLAAYIFLQVKTSVKHFGARLAVPSLPGLTVDDVKSRRKILAAIEDPQRVVPDDDAAFVMFHAEWCGHCKQLLPAYESLASARSEDAAFHKCEDRVLQASKKANDLGVNGYPHIVFFKKGVAVDKLVGNQGHQKLSEFISRCLGA